VPADATHVLRKAHGAMKPPEAMAELVRFFTKRGERILDPFAGVGGILLGAELEERGALGVEIDKRWVEVFERIKAQYGIREKSFVPLGDGRKGLRPIKAQMVCASCLTFLEEQEPESFHAVITDPPYGVGHSPRGFKQETNFSMSSEDPRDFGNARSISEYLELMEKFGALARKVLKGRRYLIMLVGDRYMNGEYIPLGVRVADALRAVGFELKGIKIWWNKTTLRPLRPYAVGSCFVPNITHQNVLVLRKR